MSRAKEVARAEVPSTEWLKVESLDLEAQGVAHNLEGKVVFIEDALPGEEVQVRVTRRKNNWEQGTMHAMRHESAQRVRPGCPHFGTCGGCKMQHLHVGAQVATKQRALEDALWHLGKFRPGQMLRPIEGPAWGYRYRARLSVRFVAKKGKVLGGVPERKSSFVADMDSCAVLPPHVSALLLPLRELVAGMDQRDRLPQIELAVGDEVVAHVLRHLEPLSDADLEVLHLAAAAGAEVRALGPHALRALAPKRTHLALLPVVLAPADLHLDHFARQRALDEHDLALEVVRHALRLEVDRFDLQPFGRRRLGLFRFPGSSHGARLSGPLLHSLSSGESFPRGGRRRRRTVVEAAVRTLRQKD